MYKIGYFPRPTVESNVELPLWLDELREDVQGDGTPVKPGLVTDVSNLTTNTNWCIGSINAAWKEIYGDAATAKPGILADLAELDTHVMGDGSGTPGSQSALDERVKALIRGTGLYRVVREYYDTHVIDDNDWQSFLVFTSVSSTTYDVYIFPPSVDLAKGSKRNKWIPEIISSEDLGSGAIEMPLWNYRNGSNIQLVWQTTEGGYFTRILGRDANGNAINISGGPGPHVVQLPLHRRALLTSWGWGTYSVWIL